MTTQTFDFSHLKGIKKREARGAFNRRFTEDEVARIRECYEANKHIRGAAPAIARKIDLSMGGMYWIVTGRAYK